MSRNQSTMVKIIEYRLATLFILDLATQLALRWFQPLKTAPTYKGQDIMKTGVPALIKAGEVLCHLIDRFSPVIIAISGDDENVVNALAAANAACKALTTLIRPLREFGD